MAEPLQKFTLNLTAVFNAESYAAAQAWVVKQLSDNEEQTEMNIQQLSLVRWSDPYTNRPIDPATGKPVAKKGTAQ